MNQPIGLLGHMNFLKKWIFLSFLVFQCTYGWAQGNNIPGSRYVSARASALGDSAIALLDDPASGLFYNPAAIARIRKPTLEPFNLRLEGNKPFLKSLSADSLKIASGGTYSTSLQPGEEHGLAGAFLPAFGFKGFAFGALVQVRYQTALTTTNEVRYRPLYQFIPAAGFGLRLASGVVRIGYSFQWVNETSGDLTVPQGTALGSTSGLSDGSAFSHNVGLALTLPYSYLPSFTVVARNLLQARFQDFGLLKLASNRAGAPPTDPTTFDAGLSLSPRLGRLGFSHFLFAYRDVSNQSGTSVLKRAAFGWELDFKEAFYLRFGYGNGYPSAGMGLRRKKSEVGLSWYSEEIGNSNLSIRDQRIMLQIQVRAF